MFPAKERGITMPLSPDLIEITRRIRALREDLGITQQEMADATERSLAEYVAQESGEQDLSFTFLHKCAERLGVDITALLTGETPHLGQLLHHARRQGRCRSGVAPDSSTSTRWPPSRTSCASRSS